MGLAENRRRVGLTLEAQEWVGVALDESFVTIGAP